MVKNLPKFIEVRLFNSWIHSDNVFEVALVQQQTSIAPQTLSEFSRQVLYLSGSQFFSCHFREHLSENDFSLGKSLFEGIIHPLIPIHLSRLNLLATNNWFLVTRNRTSLSCTSCARRGSNWSLDSIEFEVFDSFDLQMGPSLGRDVPLPVVRSWYHSVELKVILNVYLAWWNTGSSRGFRFHLLYLCKLGNVVNIRFENS